MLRDRDEAGLVVRGGVDGRELVGARWEAVGHVYGDGAIRVGGGVDALEERELRGIQDLGRPEVVDGLYDEMRVADDVALIVDELRRRVVVLLRVDKAARLEVCERHLDRELLVGLDGAQVGRVDEFGRGHVGAARDHAHRRRVARAVLDLLSVRERLVDGEAEVDEVVVRGQRGDLARFGVVLPVVFEALGGHAGIQSCLKVEDGSVGRRCLRWVGRARTAGCLGVTTVGDTIASFVFTFLPFANENTLALSQRRAWLSGCKRTDERTRPGRAWVEEERAIARKAITTALGSIVSFAWC